MNPRSLAFRLGAGYTLLVAATFVLVGAATFYGLQQYLRANLGESLSRRSRQVEQILMQAPPGVSGAAIAQEIETRVAPEFNNRFVRITLAAGPLIFKSGAPADRSFNPAVLDHVMMQMTQVDAASGRYLVELGVSTQSIDEGLARLLDLLGLLLPVLIFCAAAGGYWLVNRALRPVDGLSHTAEQMSLQNLALRLPVAPSGDALERLAISLNNMLGRLRDSVQTSRRFLADASHELRTPLTVIKGELQELTRESTLTRGQVGERVGSVLEEVARLEHLVSGLLVLSRLDAGEPHSDWLPVDIAELASSTAEQMRLIAEDRGIEIRLVALRKAIILGDRAQLKQIVVNLLDNAIRFTPRGGCVVLRTAPDDNGTLFEISDTGIGIPPDSIAHVFDRFFRVDASRSRDDGGAGLGLSIVKSICTAHGAEIDVQSMINNGSSFRVRFPRHEHAALPVAADAD
jgi:heavy metal sensor kinase